MQKTAYDLRISDCSSDVCSSTIIVCGHSDCGAMKALMNPHMMEGMPNVAAWLRHSHAAEHVVRSGYAGRSEEHTSELQSLMRISYAVFCLKKKKNQNSTPIITNKRIQY